MLPSMLISSQSELSTACQSHNAHLSVKTSIVSVNFLVSHRLPHILWNPSSCMLKQLLPAWHSAAKPPATVAAVDRWTDWRTDTRPLRRRCCAYYVGSINNSMIQRTLDMSITLQRLDANAICFICCVLHPLSWSRQMVTEQMDIRNHAHSDQPRVKWLHWRRDLWCLVLTSRGIGLQFTAELKGTWNTRFLTSDPTDRDNMYLKSCHANKVLHIHGLILVCWPSLIPATEIDRLVTQNR